MAWRVLLMFVGLAAAQKLLIALVAALWRGNIYRAVVVAAVATTPAVWIAGDALAGTPLTMDGHAYLALLNLAIGGFLFHFMTLPDRSVTLRVLVELELAPAKTLSIQALAARYSVRDMIASRLEQMAGAGFIAIDAGGRIEIRPRGAAFGRFVTGGRRLFNITSAN